MNPETEDVTENSVDDLFVAMWHFTLRSSSAHSDGLSPLAPLSWINESTRNNEVLMRPAPHPACSSCPVTQEEDLALGCRSPCFGGGQAYTNYHARFVLGQGSFRAFSENNFQPPPPPNKVGSRWVFCQCSDMSCSLQRALGQQWPSILQDGSICSFFKDGPDYILILCVWGFLCFCFCFSFQGPCCVSHHFWDLGGGVHQTKSNPFIFGCFPYLLI